MSDTDASSDVFDISIPITHHNESGRSRPSPLATIERQMDKEVEQVFREWDDNVKCRKQSSFHVRPASTSAADKRRRRGNYAQPRSAADMSASGTKFEFPEIDIIRKEDTNYNSSTESLEDDSRRQFYLESPITGQRMFRMEFDVSGYNQDKVSVKVSGSRLVVHAIQEESDSGRKSTTELCRKVKLPPDVNTQKITCNCANGRLIVEAPAPLRQTSSNSGTPTFSVASPRVEPLNKPIYRNTHNGKNLHLTVELGRLFRADDVLVKVKSQNKLVIHAERNEETNKSKMAALITHEFDLDEKIVPQSLKAGLTVDGLLKISADVFLEVRVITNGCEEEEGDTSTLTDSQRNEAVTEHGAQI